MSEVDTRLGENPLYIEALTAFSEDNRRAQIYGLVGSQKAFVYSRSMRKNGQRPTLLLVHDKEHKEQWERDISFLLPEITVLSFPMADTNKVNASAKTMELQAQRMQVLTDLARKKPVLVIALPEEAAQRLPAPERITGKSLVLEKEQDFERDSLLEELVAMGYERVSQVEQRGQFSVRGDILDIYTSNEEEPVRVEFFGDTIDTMRQFALDTQRSIKDIDSCSVYPFIISEDSEGQDDSSLLSYMDGGLVLWDEPNRIEEKLQQYCKEDPTHTKYVMPWNEYIRTLLPRTTNVSFTFLQQRISAFSGLKTTEAAHVIGLQGKGMSSFERQMPLFIDEVKHWQSLDRQIILVVANQQRREGIGRALQEAAITYEEVASIEEAGSGISLVAGLLTEGFEFPYGGVVFVTEGNIYGQQKKKLRKKAPKGQEIRYFTDLEPGDYVVHSIHGIGKYIGLKTIETEGVHRDYIEIAYAGSDRLFLPAENLDQLQKYIGNEGDVPRIHKMGGSEWRKVKAKAQKSIDDLAEKLVALYAKREIVQGFAFLPDQPWQKEFEDAFPYKETEDQLKATAEIKESMEKPYPMDRLLCGDVGFGKTEVAMRAIFKAVLSGKQVAVLVPTTVLSQQHAQTFSERFEPFGVHVGVINRFRSAREKKEIKKAVANGDIDVLIGTHSILNKSLKFKNLGMLVVDEEQRFGVAQKEKWKSWANNIDVLTLSATPIPRTLHMSLVGVREMSVINTPPEERLPVQTYVLEYDMRVVVEAIQRELQRGGQVYFVYNRVASISHMADLLLAAMPDLRLGIAHGQMAGHEMESVMQDFYEGQYDVLLCTSIIETGLDIPNVNTIIVYDADHLGLSQLYQMRGRVGRSRRRAYAYFMYRRDKMLNEAAEKRLKAIEEFTELGAGFKLAMRDLEIRGAGNLLGSQQHGNIASVGFAMYCTMLEEAIAKAKNEKVAEPTLPDPLIDIEVDAFIDEAYIADNAQKISVYQQLLRCKSQAEVDEITDELVDRFGTPTKPVNDLLAIAAIKERARLLGIKSLVWRNDRVSIHWQDDSRMEGWDMAAIKEADWKRLKVLPTKPTSLTYQTKGLEGSRILIIQNLLSLLEKRSPKEGA